MSRLYGKDQNSFKTISKAAQTAQAGDTITVHEGIYREWVNPPRGGTEDKRIVYQAAPGEKVTITGAEIIKDWENAGGTVWKTVIPNSFFGSYNPYKEVIYGDWLFTQDKVFHTGEVYLNGKSMYESVLLEGVINPKECETSMDKVWSVHTWFCAANSKTRSMKPCFFMPTPAIRLRRIAWSFASQNSTNNVWSLRIAQTPSPKAVGFWAAVEGAQVRGE